MLSIEDFYSRLGLPRDAEPEDIRSAYFEAARRLHPDSNSDPGAVEQFLYVQEAYDVLVDPTRRKTYDTNLPPQDKNSPALSFNAIFSRCSISYMDEPQLVYALLDLTSIPDPGTKTTPPLNLCLVIDRSTSMHGERIDMVKANVSQMLKQLRPQDIISVVVYSDRADVLIPATRMSELNKTQSQISMIQTFGGTEILHGLEAGISQLRRNQSPVYISHLILLTDGRTYGDEQACLELASQAAKDGIGISGLGIGNEWNDAFLDRLAGYSGSTSTFISGPTSLKNFLEEKVTTLGRVYAESVTLEFEQGCNSSLQYAFRIQPEASLLPTESPIHVGNIAQFHSLRILLEFHVNPIPTEETDVSLCQGYIKMEVPTRAIPSARIRLNLHLPVTAGTDPEQPPQAILQCMSRLTLYRMQEKARQEVAAGEMIRATRHLQHLATHLLSQGEKELAQAVLMEAESINNTHAFSKEGEKRIKYGTRALLLPSGSDRIRQ
ncbi:MAG: VWA domain-containing protein [Anaerolineaceae bacterium]|nr:VWA domain-containing protein [Anaerolineaceae bacterium]